MYGLDLGSACYGPDAIGVRRLRILILHLPPGSPLHRAMEPEAWSWTTTEELLAVVAELLDLNNRLFFQANSKKGSKPPKPLEIRRPYEPARETERRTATAEEIRSFFKR